MNPLSLIGAAKIIAQLMFLLAVTCEHGIASTTYSLLIGLSKIDDARYLRRQKATYDPDAISGTKLDIQKVEFYCKRNGHKIKTLVDEQATHQNIIAEIESIGKKIQENDSFIFYFTGHGDRIKDLNHDEASGKDQVLIAYDDYVVDDEIYILLKRYFKKSRNLMIVDACHSSTLFKVASLVMDFRKAERSSAFLNENLVEKQNMSATNCNLNNLETIDEPFDLVYFGATPDDDFTTGNSHGGTMTILLDQILQPVVINGTIIQYTYRRIACELAELMMRNNLYLQYHEIGLNVKRIANDIPFK